MAFASYSFFRLRKRPGACRHVTGRRIVRYD